MWNRVLLICAALLTVFSTTVRSADNLARRAKVSVDSTYDGYVPIPLNDGVQIVASSDFRKAGWASAENDSPHWVQLDWDQPVTVASVIVYWTLDGGQFQSAAAVHLQVRAGEAWKTVAESAPEPSTCFSVMELAPVRTAAIRLLQPSLRGPVDRGGLMWIAEVEAYGVRRDAGVRGEPSASARLAAGGHTVRFDVHGGENGGVCDIKLGAMRIGRVAGLPDRRTTGAVEVVSPGGDAGQLLVKASGGAGVAKLRAEPIANSATSAPAAALAATGNIRAMKPLYLETLLTSGGSPRVVIVSSSRRPAYAEIAGRVRDRIRELAKVEVEIVDAEKAEPEELLSTGNAIVLGNLVTSRFVEILYWEWYTILDLWYPGPGGHVLRTLHNPYGTGGNVILLGGSDDAGVAAAAAALCKTLQQGELLKVGRLMEIKLGENHKLPPEDEWTDPRLRIFHETLKHKNVHECPLGFTDASLAGLRYYYNGDEAAAARFRELALNTDILGKCYHYYAHMHPIIWDLIEESPVFSDADRLAIVNKLLRSARSGDGTAGRAKLLSTAEKYRQSKEILDRHTAMHANCTLTHSRYFSKYWPAEEWTENLKAVRIYYDRSMTSSKGWRDEGNMHTYLECPLIASQLLRDRRFVDSGALRHYAELLVMYCDNRGYMSTYGGSLDTVLRTCAAMLDDPGILATFPRRKETELAAKKFPTPYGFLHGQAWATGLDPEPLEKMIGVFRSPLTRWCWEYYGKGFPFEKGVDKLSMRSGFGRNDQFMLLDGISVGGGKPCDNRNTTVSFVQNGCRFLYGSTKTMVVSRGGLGAQGGKIVSLEAMANLPSFGYSQTRAADHPFSTWDRSVFWRKGKWFFFLDRVTVREAGTYSIACSWNTRGSISVTGHAAEVSQGEGEDLSVMHLKNAKVRDFDTGGVRETVLRKMDNGGCVDFANLLYVSGGPAKMKYEALEIAPSLFAVTGDEDAYLGVTEGGSFERAGVTVRGTAFCVSPVALSVVAGRELRWHELSVTTSVPCGIEFEPRTGRITVETDRTVQVTVGQDVHACEAGTHTFSAAAALPEQLTALATAIRTDVASVPKKTVAGVAQPESLPALPVAWNRNMGPYASYCVGDVDGNGSDEIVLGMADGRVVCLSDAGDTLWEHKLNGEIRAVACAVLPGGRAVIAGSKNEHVYALTADGSKILWQHKLYFSQEVHDRAPWWTEGGRATAKGILVDDLDGDGVVEIVCGTGATFVETLTPGGETKWLRQFLYGRPDRFVIAPMAQGKKSLLVDAGQACGCCTWRLAADGKILSKNAFPSGRGSWDGTRTRQIVVADMDGKGTRMALVGRGGAFNELGLYDAITGQRKWQHRMADQVSTVAAFDTDGDGVKEVIAGSVSAWLCAFNLAGKQVWAEFMPAAVQAVTAVGDVLYVQCADACVYGVSGKGKLTGKHRVEGGNAPTVHQPWRLLHKRGRLFVPDRSGQVTILTVGDR